MAATINITASIASEVPLPGSNRKSLFLDVADLTLKTKDNLGNVAVVGGGATFITQDTDADTSLDLSAGGVDTDVIKMISGGVSIFEVDRENGEPRIRIGDYEGVGNETSIEISNNSDQFTVNASTFESLGGTFRFGNTGGGNAAFFGDGGASNPIEIWSRGRKVFRTESNITPIVTIGDTEGLENGNTLIINDSTNTMTLATTNVFIGRAGSAGSILFDDQPIGFNGHAGLKGAAVTREALYLDSGGSLMQGTVAPSVFVARPANTSYDADGPVQFTSADIGSEGWSNTPPSNVFTCASNPSVVMITVNIGFTLGVGATGNTCSPKISITKGLSTLASGSAVLVETGKTHDGFVSFTYFDTNPGLAPAYGVEISQIDSAATGVITNDPDVSFVSFAAF